MINSMKKMKALALLFLMGICCSMTEPKEEGSRISIGAFKAQSMLRAVLKEFDFDAKCSIASFTITRLTKHKEVIPVFNVGGLFQIDTKKLVSQADHGDVYYFDDIKAHCPGDVAGRNIGSLVFSIK